MNKLKLTLKSIAYSWQLIFESSKFLIFLYFALMLVTTLFPLLSAFLLKYILDALTVTTPEIKRVLAVVIIYGLSLAVHQGISSARELTRSIIDQKAKHLFECRLSEKLALLPLDILDSSSASEVIKDWENGYDSVLGRYYADNGKDLSGGQWQLVGLARAYFKNSEYMILDEPSAALDPISEDRIFEQLYHLSEGKSSVTISHRLSNTTLADKILVIGDGHIIEQGSHADLLRRNGRYAYLFNLQASKYL